MLYNLSAVAGTAMRALIAKRALYVVRTTLLTTALLTTTFVPAFAQDQGQPPNQQDQQQNQPPVQQQDQQQGQAQSQNDQNQQGNLDWPYYGNDMGNMRFQDVDQINTGNVTQLQPAWVVYTGVGSQATSFESQPIVVDGTMYVSSPHDHVLAIDAATGSVKWTYTPTDMPSLDKLTICCGQTNRGVAVGDGKVFIARLDARLVALDAATGKQLWSKAVAPYAKDFTETMAPQYYDGKVFVGISGGEHRIRGFVSAYDAKSGDLLWRFFTIPGPGEFGHDTWTEDSWQWGGAPVWSTPAVDKDLKQLIFATGNAAPDLNGADRAGNNLFTASIVSVDLQTGKLNWYFQEVHHDIWDYDGPQPVALFTVQKDGQQIPAVGHANKNGYYYILDRRNGSPIFDVTETPVPTDPAWQHASPTQPIPATEELIPHAVSGQVVISDAVTAKFYTPPQEQPLIMQPGAESGSEWPPAAFSPRTGYVYVPAGGYEPWYYKSAPDNYDNLGSTLEDKPSYKTADHYGLFDALDTATGKLAWQVKAPNRVASGVSVAGDLVFWGQSNGIFNATDAKSGETLWSFACSTYQGPHQDDIQQSCNADGSKDGEHAIGGANGAPAVYTVDGREYVVMAFGGNTQVRSGQVSPTGDALIAFALPAQSGTQAGQQNQGQQNQGQQGQGQQNQGQNQGQQNQGQNQGQQNQGQNQGQQNQGQQGQGQQNQGQQNQGQQNQGQQNQGQQNQGQQNQGQQNQGQQNQGMQMGSSGSTTVEVTETSFKIALSTDTVPAGTVTFHVTNQAEAVPHQLTVIKTDQPADQLPTSNNKVDTSSLNVVGSSDNIQAGQNQDLTVDLTPGTYVLICNLPGHYQNGMYTSFTVQGAQGQQNQGQQNQGQQNQGQQNQGQQNQAQQGQGQQNQGQQNQGQQNQGQQNQGQQNQGQQDQAQQGQSQQNQGQNQGQQNQGQNQGQQNQGQQNQGQQNQGQQNQGQQNQGQQNQGQQNQGQNQGQQNQGQSQGQQNQGQQSQAASSQAITVTIQNYMYNPSTIQVQAGTTVTWINKDAVPHTVTSLSGSELDSGTMNQGATYSHTFNSSGTYDYYCTIHPYMKASVTVGGQGQQNQGQQNQGQNQGQDQNQGMYQGQQPAQLVKP